MNRDDEIFADALELPAAQRAAFLDQACAGDPAQRARIAALLANATRAAAFLDEPAATRPAALPEEKPGDQIGRYVIQRRLGDGGCGVVFLAEQTSPLRRLVALKVIKLGLDTREVIARFEAERQALALMDHPGIARVFDAGATATGRPYFVMEFVDGLPITRFCDEHRLSTETRLELFAQVCLAIQHAHQKGVIHRDIKPSNILVALHDGQPVAKVIDFGIAKATQGRLAEHTLVTGFDQLIGTPAYMSPEQVEARDRDLDTRSDIYALGVLLYELLSGRPPYDPQSLMQAGLAEIRRIIREVDPPRPSTRLATLTDADRATIAAQRGAVPLQLASVLRGDLDWIVMRCLEKDRERRYGTAHELADDVRRHLRHEEVTARPPDAAYRFRKFVTRHRAACASAAAIAAALILGTVVSLVQAGRARRAEAVARVERDAAQAAGQAETLARADAQRRQEQAEALLTFMLGDFRTELKKLGKLSLLDAVGEQAMGYFAALNPRDLTDTALARQAKALTQIGETRLEQARYPEAVAAFTTAYDRAVVLAARHPQDPDLLYERAQAEGWIGLAAQRRSDTDTARIWLTRYRDSVLALLALEGPTARAQLEVTYGHHNLAVLELKLNNLATAGEAFAAERVIVDQLRAKQPADAQLRSRSADLASWLGTVAERDGRYGDALRHYSDMAAQFQALATDEPAVARWRLSTANSTVFIADLLAIMGRRSEAQAANERAEAIFAALVQQDPQNRQWLAALLRVRLQQAGLLLAAGAAVPALDETRLQLEALSAAEPTSQIFVRNVAQAWRLLARARANAGQPDALAAATRAIDLLEPVARTAQADGRTVWELAQAGLLAGRLSDAPAARRHWQRVLELLQPHWPGSRDWRFLDPAAQAMLLLGDTTAARPLVGQLHAAGYQAIDPAAATTLGAPASDPKPSN